MEKRGDEQAEMNPGPAVTETTGPLEAVGQRQLRLARAGHRLLGFFVEEIDGEIAWRAPAPLPRAPQSVLGVVSGRGRMLTVLDPLLLLDEAHPDGVPASRTILVLRGDEQLALAIDRLEGVIEVSAREISRGVAGQGKIVCGAIPNGNEEVTILDVSELFATAMQGVDRRRKRF